MSRRHNKRRISWLIILFLIVVACVVIFFVWKAYLNVPGGDNGEGDGLGLLEHEEQEKEESTEEMEYDDKKVKQYEGGDPNSVDELSGVITYTGIIDGKLIIRTNIDQFLNSGECKLSLIDVDEIIFEDTVDIINSASTATCEGFDISMDKVSGDNLKIEIRIEAGNKVGLINGEVAL